MLALLLSSVVAAEEWSAPPMVRAPEVVEAPLPAPPLVTVPPDVGPMTPALPPPPLSGSAQVAAQSQVVSPQVVAPPTPPPAVPLSGSAQSQSVSPPKSVSTPIAAQSASTQSAAPQSAARATDATPPSAPHTQSRQTAAPAEEREPDFPFWQASALGTATVPTALDGSPFLVGARAELDVWRIGVLVTVDQAGTTPFTLSSGQQWTALGGYAVLVNKWARLRLLGGVSGTSTTSLAPTVGANVRVGWSFLGAEAAAVLTPFGAFQQLDLRAEGILRGGIFELHAGYRARFLDATGAGTLLTSTPLAGPHVALGLAF